MNKNKLRREVFKSLNEFKTDAKKFECEELTEMVIFLLHLYGYGDNVIYYGGFIEKCVYEWAILNDIHFKQNY